MAIKRKFPPRVATVYCSGGCRAKKDEDGALLCAYGYIGCGLCVKNCPADASPSLLSIRHCRMSRRHFLDDSIAQVQTKEKGNFRKSHKFHQLDYRFSVKKARP